IRWPKGRWRHSPRIADGMGAAVEAGIEAVFAAGRRPILIDRKDTPGDVVRAILQPEALAFDLAPAALPAFLRAVETGADLSAFGPDPTPAPTVLVCTHGVHDRCCAKFGFAAYKAMAAAAGDRFDVWESTHLGGCRVAAGAVVLPVRRKYGRIMPIHAAPLLAAEAEGRPYLPCYRGAADLDSPAQAAEVAGLRALAASGVWGTARVTPIAAPEAAPRFHVDVADRRVDVTLTRGEVADHGACSDLQAGAAPEPRTVWHASTIAHVSRPPPMADAI
ncbi:MAG: sucrase ferredoxin, partial [Pseudomonadota bacterium]